MSAFCQTPERISEQVTRLADSTSQMRRELGCILPWRDQLGQSNVLSSTARQRLCQAKNDIGALSSRPKHGSAQECHAADALRLHQSRHDAGFHQ